MGTSEAQILNHSILLRMEGLTKSFGWVPALRGVCCELARGKIVAIIGANGSGKSTLLRICAGLLRPSEGEISIGGWQLPQETEKVRAHIGYLGHQPLLDEAFSCRENLEFFADCYGISDKERVGEILERVGLSAYVDTPAQHLSRGRQQLLNIARTFIHEPDLLLLDEPTSNLDPSAVERALHLFDAARVRNKLILWVTHDLERVNTIADRVLVLAAGQLVHDSEQNGQRVDWAPFLQELVASRT